MVFVLGSSGPRTGCAQNPEDSAAPATAGALTDSPRGDIGSVLRDRLVGVLAGGLVIFIVGMQAAFLNRRPRPIDLAASTDWD